MSTGGMCDECRLTIRKLQQKLVCTKCEKKYHRTCVEGVTQDDFRSWKKDGSLELWLCTICKEGRQEPPSPPEGPLMVTTTGEDFIVLSWKPLVYNGRNENFELSYKVSYIEKNKEDIYECLAINSTLGDYLVCKVGGLSPGTEYRFSVQARNSAGLSEPLTTESFISTKKKACSPSQVSTRHLTVEQIGEDFVVLSWKRAADSCNVGVVIFTVLSQTPDQAEPSLAESQIVEEEGKLFCNVRSLSSGKEYKFFIEAKSSIGVIERYCTKDFLKITGLCSPPPPIGPLSVKDVGQDYIVLSWNTPVGYDNYKDMKFIVSHQRKGDIICSVPVKSCRLGDFFVCKVESLCPGTEYRFSVQTENCVGLSECLTTNDFVRTLDKKGRPLKPSSVTIETCGRDKVKVSWKLDPDTATVDKCVIQMLTNMSDWETVAETADGQMNSVMITRDIVGPYWVGVATVNSYGTSAATVVRHIGREPPSPPVGPLLVRNISEEDVTLSWQPPVDFEKYDKLDFRVSYSQTGSDAVIVSSSKCSKLGNHFVSKVEGLSPGTEYRFSVQAWNSDGFSKSLSCPTSILTREKKLPPQPGCPFVHDFIGEDFVRLSWALPKDMDPDDPVTFRVSYRQKDQDGIIVSPCKTTTTEIGGFMFCTVYGLSPGKEYRFSVEGENSAGVSEPLTMDYFVKTKEKKELPCPPEELIVTKTAENFIVLTWKPPVANGSSENDKLSYKVTYIEKNKDHTNVSPADYSTVGDFFVCRVEGLSPGTEYRFSVQAKNSAGLSEPLTTESFISTKKKVPPGPPAGPLVAKDIEENHVVLTWHPPTVSDKNDLKDIKFKVKYCQKGQTNWKSSTVWGQLGSLYLCKVTNLSPGTEYKFSVQAQNSIGVSASLTMAGFVKTKEKKVKPSVPRGPLVVNSISSDSAVLSWGPPEVVNPCDVIQYVIAKRNPGGIWHDLRPNFIQLLSSNDDLVSYKVSYLQRATEYQFAVRARNDIGDSKFLETQSVIRTKNFMKPLMPSGVTLQSCGPGELKVSWKINRVDFSTVDYCEIKTSTNKQDWVAAAKTTDGQTDSITIAHQYTGQFYVGVAAVNDAGSSSISSAMGCSSEIVNNALNKSGFNSLGMPDLPFFNVEEELIKARVITSTEQYMESFKISSKHFGQLRLTKNAGLKIHLRFCFKHNVHEMPRNWPSIYVNARQVWPKDATVDLTRKCMAEPLDVTAHCYGPDRYNHVRINHAKNPANKQMTFCFSLSIVKEHTPQQLCDKLVANQMQPPESTRNTVKAQLGEDEEIAATSVHASLLCPIGKTKMRYPCRSRFCHHVQCLDAVTMVSMNAKKTPWTCQICDTTCSFSDLVIDGLFTEILNTVPLSVNEVEFGKDGTWTYKGKKGDNPEKEKADECETSVIDLDLSNTLEMIDLTETDDEGTPVPKKEKQFKEPESQSSDKIREPLRINNFIMNTANRIVEQVGRIRDLAFGTSGHDGLGENYQSSTLSHYHRNSNNYNANRNRNNQPYSRNNRPAYNGRYNGGNSRFNGGNSGFNGGNSGFNGGSSSSYYSSSYRSSSYRDYDDPSYYNRSRWR